MSENSPDALLADDPMAAELDEPGVALAEESDEASSDKDGDPPGAGPAA